MTAPPPNPFRGLVPYGENDRLYGRDADLMLMKDRIFRARTTLLFAGSGVGKTSFFKAKLIPEIQRRYRAQFRIVYHNRWTSQEPLTALKETLSADLARPLRAAFQTTEGSAGNAIVVLDQFEELFQHHLYWPYFDTFRDELCDLINDATIPVQVVFSMREEFLGQLSAFDNRIPDIFGNYYRLKNPDTRQAEEIIEATVTGAGAQVHSKGLEDLVGDLTRIEVRGATRKSKKNPLSIRRDFVVPPHLQLVCQKLWDAEVSHFRNGGSAFEFLADYADRRGSGEDRARAMLEQFCIDAMNDLSLDQRNVAARAFDFLVTSQGAKMAYELKSLARHMGEPEHLLGSTLDKLSAVKILRKQERQDERWYELYHDMYAPIVWDWKERFEGDRRLELRATAFDRKAVDAEACENRDDALLYWLKALEIRDTPDRRRQAGRLAAELGALEQTFRHEGRITSARLSPDRETLITAMASVVTRPQAATGVTAPAGVHEIRLVQMWKTDSGEPQYAPTVLSGEAKGLEICPGDRIAVLTDNEVSIVDARSMRALRHHKVPGARSSLTLKDSGRSLVAAVKWPRPQWRILPADGGTAKRTPSPKGLSQIVVDAHGKYVLTRSRRRLRLVDATHGRPAGPEIRITADVTAMAFGARPGLIAVGCDTGRCEVWDALAGTLIKLVTASGDAVISVGFARDDSVLTILRRSAQTYTGRVSMVQLFDFKRDIVGGELKIGLYDYGVGLDTLGERVLTPSPLARLVEIRSGLALDAPWDQDKEAGVVLAGQDTRVISADVNGRLRIWNIEELAPRHAEMHESLGFTWVTVDNACERAATVTSTGRVQLWNIAGEVTPGHTLAPSGVAIISVVLHPTLPVATTRDRRGMVTIWDTETGGVIASSASSLESALFHPKESCLLLFGYDSPARLWWFGGKRPLRDLRVRCDGATFSTDGSYVALRSVSGAVHLVDTRRKKPASKLPVGTARSAMIFSPDSRYVATAGEDQTVRLWKVPSGAPAGELSHLGTVDRIAFSPRGRYLATTGSEQLLRIWDVSDADSPRELGRFRHGSELVELNFSDDEQTVIAASQSRLHAFRIDRPHGRPPGLGDELRPVASRNLTGLWLNCHHILDAQAHRVRVVVYSSYWAIHVVTLRLDAVEGEPIQGNPKTLLARWQKRLALHVEGERIVPSAIVAVIPPPAAKTSRQRAAGARDALAVPGVPRA